jgi:hypothetical protein
MQLVAITRYVRGSEIFQNNFSFFARAGKLDVMTCRFGPAGYSDPGPHLNDKADFIGDLPKRGLVSLQPQA